MLLHNTLCLLILLYQQLFAADPKTCPAFLTAVLHVETVWWPVIWSNLGTSASDFLVMKSISAEVQLLHL